MIPVKILRLALSKAWRSFWWKEGAKSWAVYKIKVIWITVKLAPDNDDDSGQNLHLSVQKMLLYDPMIRNFFRKPEMMCNGERPLWHITLQRNNANHIDKRVKGFKLAGI